MGTVPAQAELATALPPCPNARAVTQRLSQSTRHMLVAFWVLLSLLLAMGPHAAISVLSGEQERTCVR